MAGRTGYVRYRPPYSSITPQLSRLMTERKVASNGWPVMVALCSGVHENGVFDVKSSRDIAEFSGLSERQVARGMAELKERGIIVPIYRKAKDGSCCIDRSCFGHVAQYCFTKEAWQLLSDGIEKPTDCAVH